MRNTYVLLPSTGNLGLPLSFGNTFYPYSLSTPIKMINKREADPDQVLGILSTFLRLNFA